MGERGDVLSGAPGVTPEEARDAARKLGRRETLLVAWTVLKELYEEWDFTIPWERWRRLAAEELGRGWIGIEIEPKWYEVAKARISGLLEKRGGAGEWRSTTRRP
jgi:hypothetical protein